ncbi:hypothetical protein NS365_05225 [Aureimonas ureilytica]|uniref:Acyltransferase n=1 Tax=Aureimonas ureilytica TaxID=401562 RepID=A0A175RU42_9HYPH|nr:acyltransferase family protein [Aureimonas ureilytica]KTR07047.1 hypothetical protein NS365_05225 [Aureimonas ureilytica]
MTYREDIDGLRAIAVLSVILYHFKFTSFGGGYIGVDVFFVISGYLITGIIAREIEQGRFSFLSFYERRIRRIFPALFVVLMATAVYGLWGLYPTEYKELGGSIAATLAFASNFFFYSLSDYFRPDVEIKPLLHTWSLAVEEQYYLVFPLFLVLAYRYSRRLVVPLIVGIGLVSFALSVWLVRSQPAAAFYLSPPRFWEMLVGSFLALAPLPALRARWSREIVSILGLGAILASALFYKSGAPFPGFRALPPVLGAAAVLYAGEHGTSWVARLLSMRPMVVIGLMSYSLYLWHWPIAAFAHLWFDRPLEVQDSWVLLPLTAVLSFVSWHFVERPFRKPGVMSRSRLWATNLSLSGIGIVLGIAVLFGSGFPSRFTPQVAAMASNLEYDDAAVYRRGTCFIDSNIQSASDFSTDVCLARDPAKPNLLLIGDSHAAHLWIGLKEALPSMNVMQAASTGCKPVIGGKGLPNCVAFMNGIFERLNELHPSLVLLSGRWSPDDLPYVTATASKLKADGWNVVVSGPIVEYQIALARILADADRDHHPGLPAERLVSLPKKVDALLRERMASVSVPYVSVYELMCPNGVCQTTTSDGDPMQWDYGHLTKQGSIELAKRIVKQLPFAAGTDISQTQ